MSTIKISSKVFKHDAQTSGFEPDTHVDLGINFKRLISKSGNSYILEGIRGTGKTHILKMIINEAKMNFNEYKVIPAFLTIASSPQLSKEDPKYFRIFLYVSIIRSVCKFISENKSEIVGIENKGLIQQIKHIFNLKDDNYDLNANIDKIFLMADEIIQEFHDNPDKIINRVNKKNKNGIEAGVPFGIAKVSGKSEEINEDEQIKEYNTIRLSDIYGIDILISFLRTVKKLLKLNYIYILLDECSESNKEMQIEIFRLCKQIRGCCSDGELLDQPDVVFMAAVYPPQSTYYPSTSRKDDFNFQPGHDCTMEYLEMDELNDEFESFFKQLIENRLKLNNGGPKKISEIFTSEDIVYIAAYCSGGVPRRFLEILKQAYNQLSRDYGAKDTSEIKKINATYIISAIGQVVEGPSLLSDSMITDDDSIILEKIIKKFAQRNKTIETKKSADKKQKTPITIYFTTAAKSAGEIGNLISVGIIHDKKRTRSRKSSSDSWKGSGILCSLDIGVALHRGVISRTPARLLEICRQDVRQASYRGFTYVLDMPLEGESLDLEYMKISEYRDMLEQRIVDLDGAFMEKSIDMRTYRNMMHRYETYLDKANKRLDNIKEKITERKKKSESYGPNYT